MKRYGVFTAFFSLGILVSAIIMKFAHLESYDLEIYRGNDYELWISNELAFPIAMAPYRHIVRYRKLCENSGNICSDWMTIANFKLDSPSRASDWKITSAESELRIEFPEKIVVRRVGESWVMEKLQ